MTLGARVLRWGTAAAALACAGASFAACSASDSSGNGAGSGGIGANGSGGLAFPAGAAGTNGSGGSGTLPGAGGGAILPGGGGVASIPDGEACAQSLQKGEFLPIDMYLLIDKSSSMLEETASGTTKWAAIESALETFLKDPGSSGFGVGLQYFPQFKPGVPATCTADAQCGTGGPCFLKTCDNSDTLTPCSRDNECGAGASCVDFGLCEFYPRGGQPQYCAPLGGNCTLGYGRCLDITDRWCINGIDCQATTYAAPAVAIANLPGSSTALINSLRGTTPEGRTPTGPALQGAISQASDWAKSHAGRQVVAVLATDGLPTECTPLDIGPVSQIAAAGLKGTPKVPTYVIGVFSPEDTDSPKNLQTIAQAGGTQKAFIVDTSQDVTKQFLAALDAIRASSRLSCELQLPSQGSQGELDYDTVNLQVSPASGAPVQLVNVGSLARCATAAGSGWYYDIDPKSGGTPTKIVVCPDVCNTFQNSASSTVNLQIGCKTIVR